ncbi:MAG: HAD-IIB family hydrolase [Elusimicrobia bacterium]|nr:HAD-IIB family hydrolase [Elusimicrobiota bacterium]
MRYLALACDYDGTLAEGGKVDAETLAAVERLKASGRRFVLVTGRVLDELLQVFPEGPALCDLMVVENGALLCDPATRATIPLADPPDPDFLRALSARSVPYQTGRSIVASWRPHEGAVLDAIRERGLELQVIFNKDAVMVLPTGLNKATGLAAGLARLGLSLRNCVGVGDAENDHAFLQRCSVSAAVANALPSVRSRASVALAGHHGAGVRELIDALIERDLADLEPSRLHDSVLLGEREDGAELRVSPSGLNLLIAGRSGGGKSTVVAGLVERLAEAGYQYLVVDPEGDYPELQGPVVLGEPKRPPTVAETLQVLQKPEESAIANLVGLPLADRPRFFRELLSALQELRARVGRPHWLVVDEAHHLLPHGVGAPDLVLPDRLDGVLFVTVKPSAIAVQVLGKVTALLAVADARETIADFCRATGIATPPGAPAALESGEVAAWLPRSGRGVQRIRPPSGSIQRRRHRRKYAEGELPEDSIFYFRGPDGRLNLRAQNLGVFLQLAQGVDDATWEFHLYRGDYSRWFEHSIKDAELAEEARRVETRRNLSPVESRALVREAVERLYTLPAE